MRYLLPLLGLWPTIAGAVVLSDCDRLDGWRGGRLIDDARIGAGAVRYEIPETTGPSGLNLDLKGHPAVFSADQQLAFWYRVTGTGSTSLHIKIVDKDFSQGWQATWQITGRAEADGQWRRATVDLSTEFMRWGETPDLNSRYLNFRTQAAAGARVALDLDQIVLLPRRFSARLGAVRVEGTDLVVEVVLTNPTDRPQRLTLNAEGVEQAVEAPAGQTIRPSLRVPLEPAWLAAAKPLETRPAPVRVSAAEDPDDLQELLAMATKPLALPPHPRLLLSAAEVPEIQARVEAAPWARSARDGLLKAADGWLTRTITLPDRGSQWWHWYACKADGARLQTVSPTEHKCPVCQQVYTGYPYDDVVLDRQHSGLANGLRDLGVAYRLTGDARYAAKGREILLAYAARYTSYPLHNIHGQAAIGGGRVGPQTLDESTWLIPLCQGADLLWDTLSETDRRAAAEGLFRPAAEVIRQHKMGIHNIQCWKNSAVGLVGLLLGDQELIADAIESPHGFKEQMARGISADGQWYEGAWGYHFYTLAAVKPLAEAGERCGLGLYAFERNGRSYKGLFDGPLRLAMPNLLLPAFNDSGTVNVAGQRGHYESAYRRYGDPAYLRLLASGPRGGLEALLNGVVELPAADAAGQGSRNWPDTGYAILHHGEGPDAAWACLKYGPHGGGHGHPDKLNVILYRRGRIIGVDPGTTAYGVPLQREWFRTTLAHNTLTVDEKDQQEATGAALAFATAPGLSVALADAGKIYEGVTYRRTVALVGEELLLLLDQVTAVAERTFDLVWHNAGKWAASPAGTPVAPSRAFGYMHLRDVVTVTGELPPIDVAEGLTSHLAVTSANGETWLGTGIGGNAADRVPFVLRRVKGREAVVGWAIALAGGRPRVAVSGTPAEATLTVTHDGKQSILMVSPDAAEKVVLVSRRQQVRASRP